MEKPAAKFDSQLVKAALVGLETRFGHARNARAQIEAEADERPVSGPIYEEPDAALGSILKDIYELLLVVLEAAGLPRSRRRLIHQWTELTKTSEAGSGTYDRQYEFFDSPTFQCIEGAIDALRLVSGDAIGTRESYEIAKLESILQKTAALVRMHGVTPTNEREVRDVMHKALHACFTEYTESVSIHGVLKNFKPDGGVRDLGAAIEFKFAASQAELLQGLGGIFEDSAGYKGSKDWTRFYSVICQTESFETVDRLHAEISRGGLLTWTPILVTGTGARRQRKPRSGAKGPPA